MKTSEQLRAEIAAQVSDLAQYRSSDLMRQWVILFDLLIESYSVDLATVLPERLQRTQGALQQINALRRSLCDNGRDGSVKI